MQNVNEQVRLDSRNGTGQVRLGSAGCHWITPRWDPTDVKPSVRSNPEDVSNVGESIMIGFGDGDSGAVAVCVDRTVRSGVGITSEGFAIHRGFGLPRGRGFGMQQVKASQCWFTNRPKCEHTLEQSYSGMYSIFQHSPMLCIPYSSDCHGG